MVPVGLGDAHRYFHLENVWESSRGGRSGACANSAGTDDEVSFPVFPDPVYFSKFRHGHFILLKVLEKKVTS